VISDISSFFARLKRISRAERGEERKRVFWPPKNADRSPD
jgi:hypothetical protein